MAMLIMRSLIERKHPKLLNEKIKASPIQRGQALLNNSGNTLIDNSISQKSEKSNSFDENSSDRQDALPLDGGDKKVQCSDRDPNEVAREFENAQHKMYESAYQSGDGKTYDEQAKILFDSMKNLYSQYQSGVANENNFFKNTMATFEPVEHRPQGSLIMFLMREAKLYQANIGILKTVLFVEARIGAMA